MSEFKPGIYPDLDIDAYHRSPGISSSGMKIFLESPAQYYYDYHVAPTKKTENEIIKESLAFAKGRAVHLLALEPHLFDEQFYLYENGDLPRKKEEKEALAKIAKGRTIIKPQDLGDAVEMANALRAHPLMQNMEAKNIEHSFFWEAGILNTPLRARPDFFDDELIVDIKTAADFGSFERNFRHLGYHRQAAMQIDGLFKLTGIMRKFMFLVIQKKPPFFVAQFEVDAADLIDGHHEYLQIADDFMECMLYNEWPTNYENIKILQSYKYKTEGGL